MGKRRAEPTPKRGTLTLHNASPQLKWRRRESAIRMMTGRVDSEIWSVWVFEEGSQFVDYEYQVPLMPFAPGRVRPGVSHLRGDCGGDDDNGRKLGVLAVREVQPDVLSPGWLGDI